MPVFNLNDLLRIAAKFFLLVALLGLVQFFVSFLIGKIPPLSMSGCAGYYLNAFGIVYGLRLMLSIILYGFIAKFTLNFLSNVLE